MKKLKNFSLAEISFIKKMPELADVRVMGKHLFLGENQIVKVYSPRVLFINEFEFNAEERTFKVPKHTLGVVMTNNTLVTKNQKGMREYIPFNRVRNYIAREVILVVTDKPDISRILERRRNAQQLWSNLHKVYSFKLMSHG